MDRAAAVPRGGRNALAAAGHSPPSSAEAIDSRQRNMTLALAQQLLYASATLALAAAGSSGAPPPLPPLPTGPQAPHVIPQAPKPAWSWDRIPTYDYSSLLA
jgi:hypothetical protein